MPVESAIGSHITEPTEGDSRNGRAVVEAFEAWCCGVIVSEKTLLYATVMHHIGSLPKQTLCSIERYCAY